MPKILCIIILIISISMLIMIYNNYNLNIPDNSERNLKPFILLKINNHSKIEYLKNNGIKLKYYIWKKNEYYEIRNREEINELDRQKITKNTSMIGFIGLQNVLVLRDGFVCNNIGFTINENCPRKEIDVFNYSSDENYSVISNAIALTTSYSAYVYHSIIEGLSKYMPFYLNNKLTKYNIIISTSVYRTNAAFEIMKILEFPVNIISFTPIIVENLVIPLPGTCGFSIKSNIMQLSSLLISKIANKSKLPKNTVLLLRRSRGRRYSNFGEIYKLTREIFKNQQILVYDDRKKYNYRDILLMYYESSIVIGVHGAGFSNTIACRKKTIIVEIITNCLNHCFEILSEQLEFRFIRYVYNKTNYLSNKVQVVEVNYTDFRMFLIDEVLDKYELKI